MSPHPIDVGIGRKLNALRQAKELSASQMAIAIGLSEAHYAEAEAGMRRLSAEQLFSAARELGVRLSTIFEDIE